MKKITKRLIATLLAALLIITSVPFTLPTVALAATDGDLAQLKNAISDYESKMNGTVYTNMKAAYEKYITAKEYAYAYEYGHDTSLNLTGAANALSEASSDMEEWTGLTVTSPTFNYGGAVPGEYTRNVVFSTAPHVFGGTEFNGFKFFALMPKNAVFLYDGGEMKIPAMLTAINIKGFMGNDRAALGFMLATASTEKVENSDVYKDNAYFRFSAAWNGYSKPDSGENGPSASQFYWSRAFNHETENSSIPGFDGASVANTNENEGNRGVKITSTSKDWYQYTNTIHYVGKNEAFVKGLQTAEYGFVGRSMRWTTALSTSTNDYHNYNGQGTYYVIDYRNVPETIRSVVSSYLNIGGNDQYVKNELSDIIDAITYLQEEPTTGFTTDNYVSHATTVAENVQTKKEYLNGVTVSASDLSSYDVLASAITTSKETYDYNNADGVYTEDSFAAFKTAYETSETEAAGVKTNGFTTATTGNALIAAYKALNVITPPSGNIGDDTTFTYDEETGKVTISGEGAMNDFESGAASPFGNNDTIKEVEVGDDVTYIGAHAFDGANGLETITVPATLTYGEGAFDNCPNLHTVIITGGDVKNKSADNAPWKAPKVRLVKLGLNEGDLSITSIGDEVFEDNKNTAYFFYNKETVIPGNSGAIFGQNPTIHGYIPSTAYDYAQQYHINFVEISHEHIWDDGTVTAPTCSSSGYTTYHCRYCTKTKTSNYVSPLGHDWKDEVIAPTCTERGYTLRTCQREGCDKTEKRDYTPAKRHKYDGEIKPEYNSDLPRENDSTHYQHSIACSVCGEAKSLEYCGPFEVVAEDVQQNGHTYTCLKCTVCNGTHLEKADAPTGTHIVFYYGSNNEILNIEYVEDGQNPKEVPAIPNQQVGHIYSWTLGLGGVEINPSSQIILGNTIFKVKDELKSYNVNYVKVIEGNDGTTSETVFRSEPVKHGETPSDIPNLYSDTINLNVQGHKVYVWETDPNGVVITKDTTFKQVLDLKDHDFTDTIMQEATCTEDGSMSRFCEKCGYYIENETIDAKGHSYIENVTKKATCTVKGSKVVTCANANCDYREVKDIPATGHKWNAGVVTKRPTCTEKGEKTFTCTNANCNDKKTEPINATGHQFDNGVITKQPTVEETGIKTYTCKECKATKTEILPKASVKEVTPSEKVADNAPVNKKIKKPAGITTVSNAKKKQLIISFNKVKGAQNYRVMYRKQGAKKWKKSWTKGKNKYILKKLKNKGLYEFKFAAYKKNAKGAWERGEYSKISYRYYYKEKLTKVAPSKGKIKVAWTKDKNADCYQLFYAKKKNMKGAKKIEINSKNTTSYTIKGLKKGKYYVRVRAIKKKGGKKYVGEYSQRKPAKVK